MDNPKKWWREAVRHSPVQPFLPAALPFLQRRADLRRLGFLALLHSCGSLLDAFLLRLAMTTGPAGIAFVALWLGHRLLSERKLMPGLRHTANSIANRGAAELTRQVGEAAMRRRPPPLDSEEADASITDNVAEITRSWKNHLPWVILDGLTTAGAVVATFIVAGTTLAGGLLATGLLAACAHTGVRTFRAARNSLRREQERQRSTNRTRQHLMEMLRRPSWDLFRRTTQQGFATARLHESAQTEAEVSQQVDGDRLRAGAWSTVLSTGMIAASVAWGIATGNPLLGLPVAIFVNQAMNAVTRLPDNVLGLSPGIAASRHISELLDRPPLVRDSARSISLNPLLLSGIEVDRVSYTLQDGRCLLQDLNIRIRPGEAVALVGPNGSGKTTFLSLLQRLHDPTLGTVRIDGIDLRSATLLSVDRLFAVVPQVPYVLRATVATNLRLAAPSANDEQLLRACSVTGFDRWLAAGRTLDSPVSQEQLSGGEKQRLELTRAILKTSPVLLLDEPTSALDGGGHEVLWRTLTWAKQTGRTVVFSTHDGALASLADRVMRLDGGLLEVRPAATGTQTTARDPARSMPPGLDPPTLGL